MGHCKKGKNVMVFRVNIENHSEVKQARQQGQRLWQRRRKAESGETAVEEHRPRKVQRLVWGELAELDAGGARRGRPHTENVRAGRRRHKVGVLEAVGERHLAPANGVSKIPPQCPDHISNMLRENDILQSQKQNSYEEVMG
jgi:hypothetical protein